VIFLLDSANSIIGRFSLVLMRILPVIPSAYSLYIQFLINKLDYLLFQDTCVELTLVRNLICIPFNSSFEIHTTHARK
jgi:hypothetical protein